MLNDKKSLRLAFKAKRSALTTEERTVTSQLLLGHVKTQPWCVHSQNFALYLAMEHEIDTQPLIQFLWSQQKTCYLPKITPEDTLLFARYTQHSTLEPNRFGIAEPITSAPVCAPNDLDVIFMPLVAFDKAGHRLGMGRWFYDKTLANLSQQKNRPLLIGLAYELQKADAIPQDVWDVGLDEVITERDIYKF